VDAVSRKGLLMKIEFEVEGQVRGKGRPRFTRSGHTYTDNNTVAYENLIRRRYFECCGIAPTDKPVHVEIRIFFKPAQSLSKKKRAEVLQTEPMRKPDIDNVIKVVLDALNEIAWADDKQVVSVFARKSWTAKIEERIEIAIETEE
jgi:Holliday junction resolvase